MSRAFFCRHNRATGALSAFSNSVGINLQDAKIHKPPRFEKPINSNPTSCNPLHYQRALDLASSFVKHRHDGYHGKQRAHHGFYFGSIFLGLGMGLFWSIKEAQLEEQAAQVPDEVKLRKTIKEAIDEARDLAQRMKDEVGSPGLIIAVNVNGKEVWSEGLGYANVENRVPCSADTVMRIASISKSMTMAIAGKLMEQGKLDLDKSVQHYVKEWPDKEYKGEKVELTTRQLVSHKGGIRHYDRNCGDLYQANKEDQKKNEKNEKNETNEKKEKNEKNEEKKKNDSKEKNEKNENKEKNETNENKEKNEKKKGEFQQKEYYMKRKFPSVTDSLKLFKDDALCFKPGCGFLYSSHGWTLISAVLEGASGKKFPVLARELFTDMGLTSTYLDENIPLIYNRASNYVHNDKGRLQNAPYVDNSYKWAGGGFLATAGDLCRFGDAMLFSLQRPGGYLQPYTMRLLWKPVEGAPCGWDADGSYAMGWCSIPARPAEGGGGREIREYVSHTGGAVGASSVLLVMPRKHIPEGTSTWPQGVTVAIAVNMQAVGLNKLALRIAKLFEDTLE